MGAMAGLILLVFIVIVCCLVRLTSVALDSFMTSSSARTMNSIASLIFFDLGRLF